MDQHFLPHADTASLSVRGTTVYRPRIARPEDAPALIRHYQRLVNFDRYTRFFSAMSDDGIRRYVETFDWTRMIAVCVYSDELLVGAAELGWEERGVPERAELGISVDADFRRRGLGSWMVCDLLDAGRRAGVESVYASWVGGNDAIGRIMRSYGASIWLSGNHWQGELRLANAEIGLPAGDRPRNFSGAGLIG